MSALDDMPLDTSESGGQELIGRRLSLAARRCREWMDREMAGHGGGLVGWLVLKHAGHVDEGPGLSQRELAQRLSIGEPALVRHLDRLAGEGLLERRPDPVDRRVTRLFVTPAGEARGDELAKIAVGIDAELRSILTEREAATLVRALEKIERHIATQHPQQSLDAKHAHKGTVNR